jgi:hypothetical protein
LGVELAVRRSAIDDARAKARPRMAELVSASVVLLCGQFLVIAFFDDGVYLAGFIDAGFSGSIL